MPTELETQAAQMPCPIQHYSYAIPGQKTTIACGEFGNDCTGLRWPTLSREAASECTEYAEPFRVPDVTLEKVLSLFRTKGLHIKLEYLPVNEHGQTYSVLFVNGLCDDCEPKEAVLAALLGSPNQ